MGRRMALILTGVLLGNSLFGGQDSDGSDRNDLEGRTDMPQSGVIMKKIVDVQEFGGFFRKQWLWYGKYFKANVRRHDVEYFENYNSPSAGDCLNVPFNWMRLREGERMFELWAESHLRQKGIKCITKPRYNWSIEERFDDQNLSWITVIDSTGNKKSHYRLCSWNENNQDMSPLLDKGQVLYNQIRRELASMIKKQQQDEKQQLVDSLPKP